MKKILLLCSLAITIQLSVKSQEVSDKDLKAVATESNKQKTANTKDIITTLFRAGIDNLLGSRNIWGPTSI